MELGCRTVRRRGAVPRSKLSVRHHGSGLVLVRARPAAPVARSWSGFAAFSAALVALAVAVMLLLSGPSLLPGTASVPCPARKSTAVYAAGHELLVRSEPTTGGTTLVHLCASPALGPLRSWRIATPVGSLPVQAVGTSTALAALPAAPVTLLVTIASTAGELTFRATIRPR